MNNDTLTSEEPSVCDKDEAQKEEEVIIIPHNNIYKDPRSTIQSVVFVD